MIEGKPIKLGPPCTKVASISIQPFRESYRCWISDSDHSSDRKSVARHKSHAPSQHSESFDRLTANDLVPVWEAMARGVETTIAATRCERKVVEALMGRMLFQNRGPET